jgi:uncharacterized protein YcfL
MKKYIIICIALVLIACTFVACKSENTMFSSPTTTTTVATSDSSSEDSEDSEEASVYYDKKGNEYSSMYDVVYYDRHGNEYVYQKDGDDVYFLSSDGEKLDYSKCFVNTKGVFIYDENDTLTMSDNYMSATDDDGNIYYPASSVKWTQDGELVPYFGLGDVLSSLQESLNQ